MSHHISLQLHGEDSSARVCARLHALRADIDELHVARGRMCLHVGSRTAPSRLRNVLHRLADVTVSTGPGYCLLTQPPVPRDMPTTYVVWAEPLVPAARAGA